MGEIIIHGVLYGAMIALMAVGFQLIFGILRVVNYAHGEFLMWGALTVYFLVAQANVPYFVALLISVVAFGVVGFFTDKAIMRRFHGDLMGGAMVTLAMLLFLLNLGWFALGPRAHGIPSAVTGKWEIFGTFVTAEQLLGLGISISVLIAFAWFLKFTKLGKSMRAAQQDEEASLTLGINIKYVTAVTFALATSLAALTGSLMAAMYHIEPPMGGPPLIFSFIVVILGGLGSVPGAFIASFVIGFQQALTDVYLGPQWSQAVSFGIAMLVLTIFPRGLMGHD
ncbi:branched-chain amino acid ABC transporter permease [Chloroflexota bacterium]